MSKALFIIDVQNDFTEGGALGVDGGSAVAEGVTALLRKHPGRYTHVFASRDWHDGSNDNGGHFSDAPDFVDSWPRHCVAGTPGADYHPALDTSAIDVHVKKGQGKPAYSVFEGVTDDGSSVASKLEALGVTEVDIAGIATDHCVRASALDALKTGAAVTVLDDLIAGVAPQSSSAALAEVAAAGAKVAHS